MNIEKLYPEYKAYIWGGEKLKDIYKKNTDISPCAESWELSFHTDGLTRLKSGETLCSVVGEVELGKNVAELGFFPTLVKLIDAKENLSVQVHPSDSYAMENENSLGKTEMWYIVDADEGAGIYLGFKNDVNIEEYSNAIKSGKLTELLNFYEVKAGDCYFIPAGTVHAIGKGCLICEIQQNSNITYRVFDYKRKDKNGKERELHIDKALNVTSLEKYEPSFLDGGVLGASKYFTAKKISLDGDITLATDGSTFVCLTCVSGVGQIDGQSMIAGDSFFVPADFGDYILSGKAEIILTEIRKYYIGIDLGGTFIKGGIVDDLGNILVQDKIATERENGASAVAERIALLANLLLTRANMAYTDVLGIGIGVPGMIDSKNGKVVYSNNLDWKDFAIVDEVQKLIPLPVKIANDANVATLGETKFGCGKGYNTAVMLTLGTGVGGGIVINGELFEGNCSAGAELGHSVIVRGGEQCTCGRKGCLEAYASATALIRDTKRAMEADRDSKMWEIGSLDAVDGKTAFDFMHCDESAKKVVDNYIEMLGTGIVNLANELRPEIVMLGGGVCAQGDELIIPLQKFVDSEIFAGELGPKVKILTAKLKNSAGILGAAALIM